MVGDAQKRATAKYQKTKTRQLNVRFFEDEYDLLEWAKAQKSTAAYIKSLIRADMERSKREG